LCANDFTASVCSALVEYYDAKASSLKSAVFEDAMD
jgi:hypothetical protein